MNLAFFLAVVVCVAYLCLGAVSLRGGNFSRSGIFCALFCLDAAFLSIVYIYISFSPVETQIAVSHPLLAAGWGLLPVLLLHFSVRMQDGISSVSSYMSVLMYLPAAAFIFRGIENKTFEPAADRNIFSWIGGMQHSDLSHLWVLAYLAYFSIYFTASIVLVFRFMHKNPERYSRRISVLIAAGVVPVTGFVAAADLQLFDIDRQYYIPVSLLMIFIWLSTVWSTISKKAKDTLSVYSGYDFLMRDAEDLLLVADNDGIILHLNKNMHNLLGYEENELVGRGIGEIVVEEEFIRRKFARIRHGLFDGSDEMRINCRTKTRLEIPILASGSSISSSVTGERDIIIVGAPAAADAGPAMSLADIAAGKLRPASRPGAEDTIVHAAPAGNTKTDVINTYKTAGRYKSLVDNALVGVFIAGKSGLIYANRKMAEMFGYSEEELTGSKLMLDLVEERDRKTVANYMEAALRNGSKGANFSFRGRQKDGSIIDVEAQCVCTEIDGEMNITGSLLEITERIIMEEAMRHQALHDPLTSLPNRMLFSDRLDMAISKAAREKTKVAVMFLDLDRFKTINDNFGHNIGDMLLQSAAGVFRSCLRDSDTVARLGGDEFTVLLSSIAGREDAVKVARKILSAVNQKWNLAGHKLHLTTSAGISIYPDDGSDSETLVRKADTSMYIAKAHGGNAYRFYEPHMDTGSSEQIQLENDLRCALDNGELSVDYQPQFDMVTRKVSGVEALLRWKHPERGLIAPECFIPVAERTGLIIIIGEWVLNSACLQVRKWHAKGHSALNLYVNVSGVQLADADFTDMVERVLKKTKFDPSRLRLEIAESVALRNLESIVPKLTKLTGIGIQFAIDDFGMGYSSLHYLKRLPIQAIKIDKSFMHDLYKNEEDASVVTAMIAMAKSLNLDTVADGVETTEQVAFLDKCRCDKMQGYLCSHPLPPDMLEALLKA